MAIDTFSRRAMHREVWSKDWHWRATSSAINEDGWKWRYCSMHLNPGPRLWRVAGLHPKRFIGVNIPMYPSDRWRIGSEIVWPFTEKRNLLLLRIEPRFRGFPAWITNYRENCEVMDMCKKRCRITVQTQLYLVYKTAACFDYINYNIIVFSYLWFCVQADNGYI
jgi:hypothetical protein